MGLFTFIHPFSGNCCFYRSWWALETTGGNTHSSQDVQSLKVVLMEVYYVWPWRSGTTLQSWSWILLQCKIYSMVHIKAL